MTLPIKLVKPNELGIGEPEFRDTFLDVLPEEICLYRPGIDDDFPDEEVTVICIKCGIQYTIYMDIFEFKKLLNNQYKTPNNELSSNL